MMCVDMNVGVSERLEPESHAPSCGGGGSPVAFPFGAMPKRLWRNAESSMIRCPPELDPE